MGPLLLETHRLSDPAQPSATTAVCCGQCSGENLQPSLSGDPAFFPVMSQMDRTQFFLDLSSLDKPLLSEKSPSPQTRKQSLIDEYTKAGIEDFEWENSATAGVLAACQVGEKGSLMPAANARASQMTKCPPRPRCASPFSLWVYEGALG